MKTGFKDTLGRDICSEHIIHSNKYSDNGWIWEYNNEFMVGWYIVGPSCEDSIPLKELIEEDKFIKIIGTIIHEICK